MLMELCMQWVGKKKIFVLLKSYDPTLNQWIEKTRIPEKMYSRKRTRVLFFQMLCIKTF